MFNRFSTNGSPVNIRFPQGFELPPQYFILRTLCTGIMLYNIFGYRTDVLQQLSVTGNIRNFQIEGDTTLLDRKSTRLNSSHPSSSRMPSSA